ncbi:coil containing protein [Vibrio phage 1.158.O._10N.261.45.E12]|nr:coil containing protein [Vibrio phage 1.158.O._10N.261.45.E12]AUR92667.1 coil containing protein [Vibrio phage 1.175.O._10N.261.55.B3]
MSENKMSEAFPEAFQVEHNKSFEVQDATWYSYGEKYESDGDQDSAIEHAVLNHDRLQQENAELREALQKTVTAIYSHNNEMVGMHAVMNCASESLKLLNKND